MKYFLMMALFFVVTLPGYCWQWARSIGSPNMVSAWDIVFIPNGYDPGIYVTGSYTDYLLAGDIELNGNGLDDIFVIKLDEFGNYLWARSFGGPQEDVALSIDCDTNSNVYITGFMSGDMQVGDINLTCQGLWDIFIIKLDRHGNVLFAKNFGGLLNDIGYGISISADRVFITGWFADTLSFGPDIQLQSFGGSDIYVACFDLDGNPLWAKNAGSEGVEYGFDIATDNSGNCFVTGVSGDGTNHDGYLLNGNGAFVAKYDITGVFHWASRLNGASVNSIGYYLDGYGTSQMVYIIGRYSGTISGGAFTHESINGSDDAYYAFLSPIDGSFVDIISIGGEGSDRGRACTPKSLYQQQPIFFGSFSDSINISGFNYFSRGEYDIFGYMHRLYDEPGMGYIFPEYFYAGGINNDIVTGVSLPWYGYPRKMVICGWHYGQTWFGDISIDSGSESNGNAFVALFGFGFSDIDDPITTPPLGLRVYPNPFRLETQISLDKSLSDNTDLKIYNQRGQLIHSLQYQTDAPIRWNGCDLHGKSVPAGIYFLKVSSGSDSAIKKICKW